jgi:hypothetical protein
MPVKGFFKAQTHMNGENWRVENSNKIGNPQSN